MFFFLIGNKTFIEKMNIVFMYYNHYVLIILF